MLWFRCGGPGGRLSSACAVAAARPRSPAAPQHLCGQTLGPAALLPAWAHLDLLHGLDLGAGGVVEAAAVGAAPLHLRVGEGGACARTAGSAGAARAWDTGCDRGVHIWKHALICKARPRTGGPAFTGALVCRAAHLVALHSHAVQVGLARHPPRNVQVAAHQRLAKHLQAGGRGRRLSGQARRGGGRERRCQACAPPRSAEVEGRPRPDWVCPSHAGPLPKVTAALELGCCGALLRGSYHPRPTWRKAGSNLGSYLSFLSSGTTSLPYCRPGGAAWGVGGEARPGLVGQPRAAGPPGTWRVVLAIPLGAGPPCCSTAMQSAPHYARTGRRAPPPPPPPAPSPGLGT